MQSTKVDVNKQIQIAVKTGKVTLGVKEALDAARFAKAKLLRSEERRVGKECRL